MVGKKYYKKEGENLRVVKEYDERKNEILDTAQRLFSVKGYEKCSVNDILKEVKIAKGTFYYYFSSKEEVLDAIIERIAEQIRKRLEFVMKQNYSSFQEKLLAVAINMRVQNDLGTEFIDELHKPNNALFHQKSWVAVEKAVLPFMINVVEEGIAAGEFKCKYTKEYMRIFLTSAMILMDDGVFELDLEEQEKTFRALIALLAQMLNIDDEECWNKVIKYYK